MEIILPNNWLPRDYQMEAWTYLERRCAESQSRGYEGLGARAAMVWHRRAGKDLFSINFCATQAFQRVGNYWHVLPTQRQGRQVVWEGKTRDGRPFLDAFPDPLIRRRRDDEMRLWFANGSSYQVIGADEPDRLVGANPVGVVFSEWSLMQSMAWDLIRPILAENGGWAVFIYTPRGRNHGWTTLRSAEKDPDWFAQKLTVDDTKAIPLEVIEQDRRSGMPEELIQQEYWCSFDAPLAGSYYGEQMAAAEREGRITKVPWEPLKLVGTAWDLGVSDATAIWFFQQIQGRVHIIDYYEKSGQGIEHYAKVLQEKPYAYDRCLVPHDAKARDIKTGKDLVSMARGLGLRMKVVDKHRIHDGITAVRAILPRCYFDAERNSRGLQALKEYTKEDTGLRDPDGKPIYKDTPRHDWTSHAADAMRTLAMGIRAERDPRKKGEVLAPKLAIV